MTFDWLIAQAKTVDGNVLLNLGNGERITLLDVEISSLHADDFLLA